MNNKTLIYGKHPIFLALKNENRRFFKIYTSNLEELKKYIKDNNIKNINNLIEFKNNNDLNKLFSESVNHQGYVALVSNPKKIELDSFIWNECKNKNNLPKLLILDQLTDPHNIGAIIRTAAAFDVRYIITTKYNSPKDSAVIVKSSAGLSEVINIIEVININKTLEILKNTGYFIIGLAGEAQGNIKTITNSENLCLIVGNEGKGIRQLIKKNCDALYKINISQDVESLNASVAAAIAIYQLWS